MAPTSAASSPTHIAEFALLGTRFAISSDPRLTEVLRRQVATDLARTDQVSIPPALGQVQIRVGVRPPQWDASTFVGDATPTRHHVTKYNQGDLYTYDWGGVIVARGDFACRIDRVARTIDAVVFEVDEGSCEQSRRIPTVETLFQWALLEWFTYQGLHCIHAAGLATKGGRGILICGASGAGKTTTALSLIKLGLRLVGDDLILLQRAEDSVCMRPFLRKSTADEQSIRFHPELGDVRANATARDCLSTQEGPEYRFHIQDYIAAQVADRVPVDVVVTLAPPVEDRMILTPISRADALQRLLTESGHHPDPRRNRARFETISHITDRARCFVCHRPRRTLLDASRLVDLVEVSP